MERRRLGRTAMPVSALGLGASEIGCSRVPLKTAAEILGSALEAGLNRIDTAACYGDGEELIGRTLGHRRKDFYLLTKCGHASGLPSFEYDSIRERWRAIATSDWIGLE